MVVYCIYIYNKTLTTKET